MNNDQGVAPSTERPSLDQEQVRNLRVRGEFEKAAETWKAEAKRLVETIRHLDSDFQYVDRDAPLPWPSADFVSLSYAILLAADLKKLHLPGICNFLVCLEGELDQFDPSPNTYVHANFKTISEAYYLATIDLMRLSNILWFEDPTTPYTKDLNLHSQYGDPKNQARDEWLFKQWQSNESLTWGDLQSRLADKKEWEPLGESGLRNVIKRYGMFVGEQPRAGRPGRPSKDQKPLE